MSSYKPETVLAQSVNDLGGGFFNVTKSIVNSADHWEGIGHFGYIYFGKIEICRCSAFETVFSPDGKYIVYHSEKNDRLELFSTQSKTISPISEKYIGRPSHAEWYKDNNSALLYLRDSSGENLISINLSFDSAG